MEKMIMGIATTCFIAFQGWVGISVNNMNTRLVRIETLTDSQTKAGTDEIAAVRSDLRDISLRLRTVEDKQRQQSPVMAQPSQ